jgi:hypothetical protein
MNYEVRQLIANLDLLILCVCAKKVHESPFVFACVQVTAAKEPPDGHAFGQYSTHLHPTTLWISGLGALYWFPDM